MNEHDTLLNEPEYSLEGMIFSIWLLSKLVLFPLLFGITISNICTDFRQVMKEVCNVTVYANNQPQVYKAKRSTINESAKQVIFVDEATKQKWSFSNVSYSISNCHHDKDPGNTHNINTLIQEAATIKPELQLELREAGILSQYIQTYRYPSDPTEDFAPSPIVGRTQRLQQSEQRRKQDEE